MESTQEIYEGIKKLTAKVREEELLEETSTNTLRARAALMPHPNKLSKQEMETQATSQAENLIRFSLNTVEVSPLIYDHDISESIKDSLKQDFKEFLHLSPQDLTFSDVTSLSLSSLRNIERQYHIEPEEYQALGDAVTGYLSHFGFEDIETADTISFYPENPNSVGAYVFENDFISITGQSLERLVSDSIAPVLVHEHVHKDNMETLVGHDHAEEVRDGIKTYEQNSDVFSNIFRQHISRVARVKQDVAKGIIGSKVMPEIENICEESPYTKQTEEIEHKDYEVYIAFGDFGIETVQMREKGNKEGLAFINNIPSNEGRIQKEFREEFGEIPEELASEIEQITQANNYPEWRENAIDYVTALTRDTISEYGLIDLDYRDETLTHFAEYFARGYRLDNINGRIKQYNSSEISSENAGTKMGEDFLEWIEIFKGMDGPLENRFRDLMAPENREQYLKTGEIPNY